MDETQTTQPDISVIIPLFNKERTIGRAIQSALDQAPVNVEVIVVDDSSTDGSAKAVHPFADAVNYIHQINMGPSGARNHGARLSNAPLLLFLDADDELAPGCLEAHLACRRAFRDIQLSLSSFTVMHGDYIERFEWLAERIGLNRGEPHYCVDEFLAPLVINIAPGSICIDREMFDQIRGFDVQLHCWEITDFVYRAYLATGRLAILSERYVTKHEDDPNGQFSRQSERIENLARFATRILGRMDDVPVSERPLMLRQVQIALRWMVRNRGVDEFRKLAAHACPLLRQYGYRARVCQLTRLPDWLLRAIGPRLFRPVANQDRSS